MLDYFKALVKGSHPDYVLDTKIVSFEGLSAVTCKWAKGDQYYCASSFFTDVWISKEPLGPFSNMQTGKVHSAALEDIATVHVFKSIHLCVSYPVCTQEDLKAIIWRTKTFINSNIQADFIDNDYGDTFYVKLVLIPVPTIVITVKNVDELIGTIVITQRELAMPGFVCKKRLYDYINSINTGTIDLFNKGQMYRELPGGDFVYD